MRQVRQIFPGVDIKLAKNLLWSVGMGAGLTAELPRLVIKIASGILAVAPARADSCPRLN
jgi:hypothetical protein